MTISVTDVQNIITVDETTNAIAVTQTETVVTVSEGTGVTDHLLLSNIGTNTHAEVDTHIADATLHFTEGSIDHTAITNIGTNTHAQIDTAVTASTSHIADATLHFTEGSIDHTAITNIGTNDHAAIDTHIADATLHFTEASISITESQISDLQSYLVDLTGSPLSELSDVTITSIASGEVLKWNGSAWINNTLAEASISAVGHAHTESDISDLQSYLLDITAESIEDLSDVYSSMTPIDGQVLTYDTTNGWQAETSASGVTDHTLLSNIGTNTHAQIDTAVTASTNHIADATLHFTEGSISITKSQISDFTESDYATGAEGDLATSALQDITAESIEDLSDVYSSMTPTDGQALIFDTTNGWQAETLAAITTELSDLSDVNTSTPTDKFVLVADGVDFESRALVEADISDLQSYLTAEVNDLTASVTWANVPNANITEGSVTQHQAALSITESQISDLNHNGTDYIVINSAGTLPTAAGTDAISIGETAIAGGTDSIAIGKNADAGTNSSVIAIGADTNDATPPGQSSMTIGKGADSTGTGSVAIGNSTSSTGNYATTIGYNLSNSTSNSFMAGYQTFNMTLKDNGKLHLTGTGKAYVLPDWTTAQISGGSVGDLEAALVWDSTTKQMNVYNGTSWDAIVNVTELVDLTDVVFTDPTVGKVLIGGGSQFTTRYLVEGDISDFGTYLEDIIEDTTPQLGGSLDVNGNSIVSASAGDIAITPDTTGDLILDGLKWPQADGTVDYFLKTDGSGQLAWADGASAGQSVQISWKFSTTTTTGDPGSSKFRYNNATPASVTEIYVNDQTNAGNDASTILNSLTAGDELYIQQGDDSANNALFTITSVTDNTGWFTFVVTVNDSNSLPVNNKECGWLLLYASATELIDLTDVSTSTPTDKNVLAANGASWVSRALVEADISDLGSYITISSTDTLTNKSIDATTNTITNIGIAEFDTDATDVIQTHNGTCLDSPDVDITSNGTVITLDVEKSGTGDIRIVFSDGVYTWDCTPADTVTLTAGSDISPQINYVYVLQSNKTLTASTSGWPAAEHAAVATVYCQSAASLQTDGAYKVHAWTDHTQSSDGQGHLSHLNAWIRNQAATWVSGCALTPAGGASTLDIATTTGVIYQLHEHAMPAFDTSTGSHVYIVNDPTTAYLRATDLTQTFVSQDANGTALGGSSTDFYNLVIWGVVSEDAGDCQLYCNLPDGAYANDNGDQATLDLDSTAIYAIPSEFKGTGFLIARLTISEAGGTYTIEQNYDLRGFYPQTASGSGGGGGASNEFIDNVFRIQDEGDLTKEIAFQASGISTATTRTITMPDADVDLADISSALQNVVEDTTPQLGGDLDGQGFEISDITYPFSINTQTGTTYTSVLADADKVITLDNASAITMTIPANASVAYPVGTKLHFEQLGAGVVTIGITTDTLNVNAGSTAVMAGQYSVATAVKITSTSWVLVGGLVAAGDFQPLELDLQDETGTTYTAFALEDSGQMVTMNNASANTVTLPANSSIAYPVGTQIHFQQLGAGATTVAITTDTLNVNANLTKVLNGQYATATAIKMTSTTWTLMGNLVAA